MGMGENTGESVGLNTGSGGRIIVPDQPPPSGDLLFYDGWDTGDMSAPNAEGFSWSSNDTTSVITMNASAGPSSAWCSGTAGQSTVTYSNGNLCNIVVPTRDWYSYSGNYCMRHRYAPGTPGGAGQYYTLGGEYEDIWFKYWIRVPVNFLYGSSGDPNKFFNCYHDGYEGSGDGSTCFWVMWRDGTGCELSMSYSPGFNQGSGGIIDTFKGFMTVADRGRWMEVIMRAKTETSPGAGDGLMQSWRRWDGVSSWTQMHNKTGLAIRKPTSGSPDGFRRGYLMGWANAAYAENTEFLQNDFSFSNVDIR